MGIRGKLSLLVPGLLAAALVGQGLLAAEVEFRDELEALRRRELAMLQAVAAPAARLAVARQPEALAPLLAELEGSSEPLDGLALLDGKGRVVAQAGMMQRVAEGDSRVGRKVRQTQRPAWEFRRGSLLVAVPLGGADGGSVLVAHCSLTQLEDAARRTRGRWLLLAAGLATLVGLTLQVLLERTVVQPLRALQGAARRMEEGVLEARVPPLEGREMQEVAQSFNRMAAALSAQRESLEQAVASRTQALEEANRQLAQLASTDGLTGVYNHRRFQESLSHEVLRAGRSGQPLSVLMLDVDHFKRFNDACGHPAGDALLRTLARTLQAELRETDLLSRYGGEEFAVLLPGSSKDAALQVAERLRAGVDRQLSRPGQPPISISVGVATLGVDGLTREQLLAAADRALYVAKAQGRNRVEAA